MQLTNREQYFILRKRNKIKLKDLAEKIGVSVAMISMYENGRSNLSKEKEIQYKNIIMQASNGGDAS